ncbi:MAG: hypothetical protein H7841_03970 [Magnetospirillum sp. WYHS-4]
MKAWLGHRPRLLHFLTGLGVAVALFLLTAEHRRDKTAGGGTASYYSRF